MSGRRIVQAVVVAFLGIAGGGAVLMLAWGPIVKWHGDASRPCTRSWSRSELG